MAQENPQPYRSIEIDFLNPRGQNTDFPEFGKYMIVTAAFVVTLLSLAIWNSITKSSIEDVQLQISNNQSQIVDLQARLNNQNAKISMEHWSDAPNALKREKANVQKVLGRFADYLPEDSSVTELKISVDRKITTSISFGSLKSMVAFRDSIATSKEFDLVNFGDFNNTLVPQANAADPSVNGTQEINTAFEPMISIRAEIGIKPGALVEGGTP